MRVSGDVVRWWMGGWKGGEKGMGRKMHRKMELRGGNLTDGGVFVTVLDRRHMKMGMDTH